MEAVTPPSHVEVKVHVNTNMTSRTDNQVNVSSGKAEKQEAISWEKQPPPPAASAIPAGEGSKGPGDEANHATELTDSAPTSSPSLAIDSTISTSPQVSEHRKGLLDIATEYINDNIKTFRRLPWIIGGVGVILLIRFYPRLAFRRYRRPSDIPRQLFRSNAQLTGIVSMTGWDSVGVWHVPLWRRVLRWRDQPPPDLSSEDELLNVKFAGVAIGSPEKCEKWLESTLLGKRVWFTLLDHTPDRKSLSSVVYTKHKGWLKFSRKWCVNEQVLAKGLGSLDEVSGFKSSKDYTKFIHRLGRKEMTAKRTGAGLWEGSEYISWWRKLAKMLRLMP